MAYNESNLRKYLPFGDLTGKENYAVTLHTTPSQVKLCGAGETPIGVIRALKTIDSTTYVIVRMWSKNGTLSVVQGESIAPGAFIKAGANGKVYAASGDVVLGRKLTTTSGSDGDVIEVQDYFGTTYTPIGNMGAATATNDGVAGMVPKPNAGQQDSVLTGAGVFRLLSELLGKLSLPSWAATTTYAVPDLVIYNDKIYRCITAHIANPSFDTDAAKWTMLGGVSAIATDSLLANLSGSLNSPVATSLMAVRNAMDKARVDVASATPTTNIGAATSPSVQITGTTGITAFDNVAAGIERKVLFAASLTLTHNATSLILPNATNILTSAGDSAVFISEGGGNWRCIDYLKADGTPLTTVPSTPSGVVVSFAGTSAPSGWLMCYGQAVSRTTYASLFSAISTTYGAGDGSTTFNLPDLRGRAVVGKDNMGGTAAGRISSTISGSTLGSTGGSETVTLTTDTMPAHSHTLSVSSGGNVANTIQPGNGDLAKGSVTSSSQGSGSAHSNVQPSMILNHIIKI